MVHLRMFGGVVATTLRPGGWEPWSEYLLAGLIAAALVLASLLARSRSLRAQVQRRTRDLELAAERQAFQAHLLSQVTDAIVVSDSGGLITTWNPGAEALFGQPADAALGRPLQEVIMQRTAANRGSDLRRTITAGGEWRGDAEIIRPSGESVFIEATLRALHDENGVTRGHLLIGHDVDARRRAELDAEVRARQQAAVASLGQRALAGIDLDLLLKQAVSLANATLNVWSTGIFEAAADGGSLRLAVAHGWSDRPDVQVTVDRAAYPGAALESEAAVTCDVLDGIFAAQGLVTSAAAAIPGVPRPYGVLVVADRRRRTFSRDDLHFLQSIANVIGATRERLAIERELRASVALQRATLDAAAEGILVTDASGRVTAFNQRLVDMWRIPGDIRATDQFAEWVAWAAAQFQDADVGISGYDAALDSGSVHTAVVTLADGRVFERHAQPQRLDGRIVGRVWSYRDLTDRVRAEEERRRLETQMQHVQKLESLGVLAGGIAHDFNNLLVGILGHAGLALSEVPPGSPACERITQLQIAAQRAAELTNQMLAYSGKGRFDVQPTDLSAVVEEMANLLRAAVAKNARLHLEIARDLPAFQGDAGQIRQVIMNLITNASDAIGAASGRIDVVTGQMSATREYLRDACVGSDLPGGEFVFAEVRDSGCGMDEATMNRIFDPFFTTKFSGRGLGLAAALGIVRSHRGAIKIASAPGKGTTFRVLLPATAARVAKAHAPMAEHTTPANARVLVVDDEASVRTIAQESLKRAGFTVATANDGESALELVRTSAFDAVLLDVTMPGMPGTEVFGAIKRLRPDLPIVLTSGYSRQQTAARFTEREVDAFIQKPFLPSALVRALQAAVSSRQAGQVA